MKYTINIEIDGKLKTNFSSGIVEDVLIVFIKALVAHHFIDGTKGKFSLEKSPKNGVSIKDDWSFSNDNC